MWKRHPYFHVPGRPAHYISFGKAGNDYGLVWTVYWSSPGDRAYAGRMPAVGEGGRDVDVDAGGVDAARELRGGLLVFGDNGFAVARRVAGDMRQRPVERRDGSHGQFVVEELGAEMLFGGMFQQPGGVVPVALPPDSDNRSSSANSSSE